VYSAAHKDVRDPNGDSAGLRHQSVEVFRILQEHEGEVISRDELIRHVWPRKAVTDDSVTQCISEIRKILGDKHRSVVQTIPKKGYRLVATTETEKTEGTTGAITSRSDNRQRSTKPVVLLAVVIGTALLLLAVVNKRGTNDVSPQISQNQANRVSSPPSVYLPVEKRDSERQLLELLPELRVALARYKSIQVSDRSAGSFHLKVRSPGQKGKVRRLIVEVLEPDGESVLSSHAYDLDPADKKAQVDLANRIAASVASPGLGTVAQHLLAENRLTPAPEMPPHACYAYGYNCKKCSGEEDNITEKAEQCLKEVLLKDPDDSRAWALQATIYAHQYWFGTNLPEPIRSDPRLRKDFSQKAINAALKSESLSNGTDSSVYWGMAEAYYSACDVEMLNLSVTRGLEINSTDPHLLASFGSWLSYSGQWERGTNLIKRALEIEPERYKKWWLMSIAKHHYANNNFEEAYKVFLKSFNGRNWLSHLQLAYTLPHLGRIEEAKKSVESLLEISPGLTIEKALESYRLWCFSEEFMENMKVALQTAGLPSRGSHDDVLNVQMPRPKIVKVNGVPVEYLSVGTGPTILFVHGALGDYRTWGLHTAPISKNHNYVSYSRRYFGTQDWPDDGENFSVRQFSDDLIGLIETLNLTDVHLVAWSSGVRTAITTAVERPDLIRSAFLFEPVEANIFNDAHDQEEIEMLTDDWNSRWGEVFEHLSGGDNEKSAESMYEVVFEKIKGEYANERETVKEIIRQNARTLPVNLSKFSTDEIQFTCDYVNQLEIPIMVAVGEKTNKYWKKMASRYRDCIDTAKLDVITNTNHYAPLGEAEIFTDAILSFVRSIEK